MRSRIRGEYPVVLVLTLLLVVVSVCVGKPENPRLTPVVLAVRAARDAVVNISTERIVQRPYILGDSILEQFFSSQPLVRTEKETSLGSGVVIDGQNHVLTNAHVILKASKISVKTVDGRVYPGKLVGCDVESDIAVIEVDAAKPLPHARIGTAKDLMIGETVIAIGNPYGYSHSVTTGVVSATGRDLEIEGKNQGSKERLYDLIQTDAPINPGNSGGPLINILGEVIGINTAILGAAEGMGFAIPIDRAMRVVEDLITYGEVHTPWLGLCLKTVRMPHSPSQACASETLVAVSFVFAHGPAASKILPGDIIEALGDSPVHSAQELRAMLKNYKANARVPLRVKRGGISFDVSIDAIAYPAQDAQSLCYEWLGFWVEEAQVLSATAPYPKKASYLVISKIKPRGPGAMAGLRLGDILTQIDDRTVRSISDFRKAMMAAAGRDSIYVEVRRGMLILRGTIP